MGTHTFYLRVTTSARTIDAAARKLAFIAKRKDVYRVECENAYNDKGHYIYTMERWPFNKTKNMEETTRFREAVDKAVKNRLQQIATILSKDNSEAENAE